MEERSRYRTKSREDGVLPNKPGIQNQEELGNDETLLFEQGYLHFFDLLDQKKITIDLKCIFHIHEHVLSPLYSWAGKIRTVNMSKGGVLFAPVEHIQSSLNDFEKILVANTPTEHSTKRSIAMNLAIIHCEFNAIHPFREGNGRTIRLFLDLVAVNAGYTPIDWGTRTQKSYIQACVDGMAGEYTKMANIIFIGLTKRKKSHE